MLKTVTGVRVTRHGDELRLRLHGEIDHHTAREIREDMDRAIEKHALPKITVDLSAVAFMDSSGLGLIVGRLASAKAVGATLTVKGTSERILQIFDMAGLERLTGLRIERGTRGEKK